MRSWWAGVRIAEVEDLDDIEVVMEKSDERS
jgi:hypothetical protein